MGIRDESTSKLFQAALGFTGGSSLTDPAQIQTQPQISGATTQPQTLSQQAQPQQFKQEASGLVGSGGIFQAALGLGGSLTSPAQQTSGPTGQQPVAQAEFNFSGTGEQQQELQQEQTDLFGGRQELEQQLIRLGSRPKESENLIRLQGQLNRNNQLKQFSLDLANKLGGFFGSIGSLIRKKVAQGFFVSGVHSRATPGRDGGPSTSTFSVTFSKLTQGLDKLITAQKAADLQLFEAQRAAIQSLLGIAQRRIDTFEAENRSSRSRLARDNTAKAQLRKRRGRKSLRVSGSEQGLLEEGKTTSNLLE